YSNARRFIWHAVAEPICVVSNAAMKRNELFMSEGYKPPGVRLLMGRITDPRFTAESDLNGPAPGVGQKPCEPFDRSRLTGPNIKDGGDVVRVNQRPADRRSIDDAHEVARFLASSTEFDDALAGKQPLAKLPQE